MMPRREPTIAVGLVDRVESVALRIAGTFRDASGKHLAPGDYRIRSDAGRLTVTGNGTLELEELHLSPADPERDAFALEATIGIDFHWEQKEFQTFRGGLRVLARPEGGVTAINDVGLETYLSSVICSEMRSSSPPELIKAHAIISRSWLLAQLEARSGSVHRPVPANHQGMRVCWTDREAHADFDVCADDHCQRYQGFGRIRSPQAEAAVAQTRGRVLAFQGRACDARFHKCCGGVTEDFRSAWSDQAVPYLVPVADDPTGQLPDPPLDDDQAVRAFVRTPPAAYCNCSDRRILEQVLNPYDLQTGDFFRWRTRLDAAGLDGLVQKKLGVELGRILSLEPVQRGPSGRLVLLRLTGESGSLVVGKELEIRRALSPSHLYSSAFVIEPEGPRNRPDAFLLEGAGWGHGVGLCQIGAAVMAVRGIDHAGILGHYYPGTAIDRMYP